MILASEFAKWTNGVIEGDDVEFEGLTFDSRTVTPNCLYAALDGTTIDGHEFVEKSFLLGASVALVKKDWQAPRKYKSLIRVDNPRAALTIAAREYRKILKAKVIGVTGSAGKTTTKELTAAFLSKGGKTSATVGNFNNDLGLPITILRTPRDADFAIWEMGSNHPGEIEYLAELAKADFGIISSVGTAHIEFFKTQDGIAREKGSLFSSLPNNGIAFLCRENERFSILKEMAKTRIVETSLEESSSPYFARIDNEQLGLFTIFENGHEIIQIELPLPGRHNISNALLAYACAREMGVNPLDCKNALSNFSLPGERWNIIDKGNGIIWINDAYNANPTSMIASLETFSKMEAKRKIAILGDMFELGEMTSSLHAMVGKRANELNLNLIITIGNHSKSIAQEINKIKSLHFDMLDEARAFLNNYLSQGDKILLKASRGMHLEKILQ